MILGLDGQTAGTMKLYPPHSHEVVYQTPDHIVRDITVLPPGTYDWFYSEESGLQCEKTS